MCPPGIQQNLHIVLIMDCTNSNFTINCESNPAFYRKCSVQWMEGWSESSMKKVGGGVVGGGGGGGWIIILQERWGNPSKLFEKILTFFNSIFLNFQ